MREGTPELVRLADYTAPAYWIKTVDLTFDLDPAKTLVHSRMHVVRNAELPVQPLRLDGEDINLLRVLVNGESQSFRTENQQLVLDNLPDDFVLEIRTSCAPEKNTQLSGLYTSGGSFFTQCEAQGFRRITYFLDRPDVMAIYTVTLRGDQKAFPVLLSNGNLLEQGELDGGRHYAKWQDPHPKPSYLFALVAGDLEKVEDRFTTASGRMVTLRIHVEPGDAPFTAHAMESLKRSMRWDAFAAPARRPLSSSR